MACSTIGAIGSAYGQLGGSALAQSPGQIYAVNGTNSVSIWSGNSLSQQYQNADNFYVTTTNTTPIANWVNYSWQGDIGQKVQAVQKKAMSLLESLREEVHGWHGSLGVL